MFILSVYFDMPLKPHKRMKSVVNQLSENLLLAVQLPVYFLYNDGTVYILNKQKDSQLFTT